MKILVSLFICLIWANERKEINFPKVSSEISSRASNKKNDNKAKCGYSYDLEDGKGERTDCTDENIPQLGTASPTDDTSSYTKDEIGKRRRF